MFRSQKQQQAQISPLEPPPTPPFSRQGMKSPPLPSAGGRIQPVPAQPRPPFAGNNMERVTSAGSSVKGEKRRSSFFGLGGKKKEKNKDEKFEVSRPRPSSFSVDRPITQANGKQLPHSLSQTNLPQSAQSAQIRALSGQQQQRQQHFSAPSPPGQARSDSAGAAQGAQAFTRQHSPQSMDLGSRPQSQGQRQPPYRAPAASLQQQKQIPRSASMTMQPPPPGTTPAGGSGSPRRNHFTNGSSNDHSNSSVSTEQHPVDMDRFGPIVELIAAQPTKSYVTSPPELEMILARTSAGGQPKQGQPGSPSNDWDAVWLQLSGISLSMWSMKETRAAAARGEKVPPTYFNITDSSLELLAPLPPPPHRPDSHPHHFVFSINTAGSNRLLFSCPSERDLARWAIGLRLAAWERSRLEEIYTGHLIQSGGREPPTEVGKNRPRMEGWVRVRVMGGTEWRRLWVVLSTIEEQKDEGKKRRRSFFGMGGKEEEAPQEPNTGVVMACFYTEQRTAKNRTSSLPVLTMTKVSQAYAVFPEQLEVMQQSNLFKVVGHISGEMVTIEPRLRESGWALLMPESAAESDRNAGHSGSVSSHGHQALRPGPQGKVTPLMRMMRWVTAFHDAFRLYGRPERYTWDPRDPNSLFFAYPNGASRSNLFLEMDEALRGDFRVTTLSAVRAQFVSLLNRRLSGLQSRSKVEDIEEASVEDEQEEQLDLHEDKRRLPPLEFNAQSSDSSIDHPQHSMPRSLTPITERTYLTRQNSTKTAKSAFFAGSVGSKAAAAAGSGGDRKTSGGSSKHESQSSKQDDQNGFMTGESHDTFGVLTEEPGETNVHSGSNSNSTATPLTPRPQALIGLGQSGQERQLTPPSARSKASESVYSQNTDAVTGGETPLLGTERSSFSQQAAVPPPIAERVQSPVSPQPALSVNGAKEEVSHPLPSQPSADVQSRVLSPTPIKVPSSESLSDNGELRQEPATMYWMNMVDDTPSEPPKPAASQTRPTITTNLERTISPTQSQSGSVLGRKPSGARAQPLKKTTGHNMETIEDTMGTLEIANGEQPTGPVDSAGHQKASTQSSHPDFSEDVASYMNYAENTTPVKPKFPAVEKPKPASPVQPAKEAIRSSFAPSQAAIERRARADQAASDQRLPGGGKRGVSQKGLIPEFESSDEDEEEEESDVGSPVFSKHALPVPPAQQQQQQQQPPVDTTPQTSARALPPVPRISQPEVRPPSENGEPRSRQNSQHSRSSFSDPRASQFMDRPRTVSQVSHITRTPSPLNEHMNGRPSSAYTYNPNPYGGTYPGPGPRHPLPNQQAPLQPPPPASRQSVWNANFSAQHGMPEPTKRSGTFVELEKPGEQLTKVFAPHGLLQAGMQDKDERSAKYQQELARETGSSLIDVPSKPPPPRAGLLGAVAAHERERKHAGGIGATLTDRERERRLAEERQREIERLQRQQAEGGMYPQQGYGYGMPNPMMNMPMMGGYPQYPGGYNPFVQQQAMMAAQLAYQQTMMAMSQHGSQTGDFPLHDPSSQSQPRSRQASGLDERSSSPAGSMLSHHTQSHLGVPAFYGYPQGMSMPQMGMGMGMQMPQMPPQMPWMMSPNGGMSPGNGMWGVPSPGQGSPLAHNQFNYMQQSGMGSDAGSVRGKGGDVAEDLTHRAT